MIRARSTLAEAAPMISALFRRWRALRPRGRAASILLAMAGFLVGFGLVDRWWGDSWPARAVLRAPFAAFLPMGFSPDGRTFLTNGRDGITSWDVASGREGKTWALKWGGNPVMGAFAPDGKTYAAGIIPSAGPMSIDLFDAKTGRIGASMSTPRQALVHLAFADGGRTLRALLGEYPQYPQQAGRVAWNPSYGGDLKEVVTWDASTGRALSSRPITAPTIGAITAVSPDGRTLAVADRVKPIQLWDLDADRTLGALTNPATTAIVYAGMGFSPGGRTLAIARVDGTIELWDVPARRLVKTLRCHQGQFIHTMIRFSPDGRSLAVTGHQGGPMSTLKRIEYEILRAFGSSPAVHWEVVVLDVATDSRLAHATGSILASYSPDGRTLATGGLDDSTRLREIPGPR